MNKADLIIIGAGPAGLTAASELLDDSKEKYDITITGSTVRTKCKKFFEKRGEKEPIITKHNSKEIEDYHAEQESLAELETRKQELLGKKKKSTEVLEDFKKLERRMDIQSKLEK